MSGGIFLVVCITAAASVGSLLMNNLRGTNETPHPTIVETTPPVFNSPTVSPKDTAQPTEIIPPTETFLPTPTPTSTLPDSTTGSWRSRVHDLELTVSKVEILQRTADRKFLRFYLSVNNQSRDSISLYLGSDFQAIDSNGQSYGADPFDRNWPETFPPGITLTGSIDLEDPVPNSITTMKISFSTIFGSLDYIGDSILISDIQVP
jgi:hypothetical protein